MDPICEILLKKLSGRELSANESTLLEEWTARNAHNSEAARRLSDLCHLQKEYHLRSIVNVDSALADMKARISALPSERRRRRKQMFGLAAAIAVVVVIATGSVALMMPEMIDNKESAITQTGDDSRKMENREITPGKTMAILTDMSGHTVSLHDTCNATATKTFLGISSDMKPGKGEELKLEVPRGGEFKVTLEDSTEVWLNSESTLRYPEVFSQNERRVSISGEAYFSVRHSDDRPFYVETEGQTIRVYGTSFNVRAYPDDNYVSTTLEKGSLSVSRDIEASGEIMLSPGHQAMFDRENETLELKVVDSNTITSWRHGQFVFEEQQLSEIMKDLGRWYNFDYEFADPDLMKIVFMGTIPRYAEFSTVTSIIEKSGNIKITVSGGKVVISGNRRR